MDQAVQSHRVGVSVDSDDPWLSAHGRNVVSKVPVDLLENTRERNVNNWILTRHTKQEDNVAPRSIGK